MSKESRQHKVGIDAVKQTEKRAEENISIRKDKRETKLNLRRGYTKNDNEDTWTEGIDAEFLGHLKNNLQEAVRSALALLFDASNEPGTVLKGLTRFFVLCNNTKYHYNDAVFNLLPKKDVCNRLAFLLKTNSEALRPHVLRTVLILRSFIQSEKENEHLWNRCWLDSGIFETACIHIAKNPDNQIREQLLYALNNFVATSGLAAQQLQEVAMRTMNAVIERNNPSELPLVAWYMNIVLSKKPGLTFEKCISKNMWEFLIRSIRTISYTTKDDNEKAFLTDCFFALESCCMRGKLFLETCKQIGYDRIVVQTCSDHDLQLLSSSTLCVAYMCQQDEEFCEALVIQRFDRVNALYTCSTFPDDYSQWNEEQRAIRRQIVNIFHSFSLGGKHCSSFLVKQRIYEKFVMDIIRQSYDPIAVLWQVQIFGNMISDFMEDNILFRDRALFDALFESKKFVEAMKEAILFTDPTRQIYIMNLLSSCLMWQDALSTNVNIRNQLEEQDLDNWIENLAFESTNEEIAAAAKTFVRVFEKRQEDQEM